jgi:hypothetical protein
MAVFNKHLELKGITDIKDFFIKKVFYLNIKGMIFTYGKEVLIIMSASF